MSDLFRALPKIKEKPTPSDTPSPNLTSAPEEDASSSDSSASTADSIDTLRPSSKDQVTTRAPDIIPWSTFFAQELYIESSTPTQTATYHVYLTPPQNPTKGPLFICHHGAGASGMSFARFAGVLKKAMPEAGILSLEAREHGSVVTSNRKTAPSSSAEAMTSPRSKPAASEPDFGLEALASDALAMIEGVKSRLGWSTLPPSVLVGHSLGGAIATEIAAAGALGAQLIGFLVLDVVEGSAIEALGHMRTYLSSRPASFATVDAAVEWHVRSRTIRDPESARASVPSLLVKDGERFRWRTDLKRTEKWWLEWFQGMSAKFLRGRAAKGLILAGTDRLDKELMVGQMQGKFQLTVIPEAGHFVQEDVPEKLVQLAVEFFRRNDRSAMVLPPKVSDLIAQGKKV